MSNQLAALAALLLGALLSVDATAAPPYELPALNVYNHCKANDTSCSDFLVTMDSAMVHLTQLGFLTSHLICPPNGATLSQDRLIFIRFAETHPEFLHRNAVEVYLAAEMAAFPCAKNRTGTGG
jgi:hypothetical protein